MEFKEAVDCMSLLYQDLSYMLLLIAYLKDIKHRIWMQI